MQKRINTWLFKYGKKYNDPAFGFNDCQMIDDCCYDLGIKAGDDDRKLVEKSVEAFIANH